MRTLTKSRFKLGMECPTKLFYTGKMDVYTNESLEDSFLASLADGGFQVGELAKAYFPGGHEVKSLDYDEALNETNELLKKDEVVIFEAAVRFEDLFIRADILVKKGDRLDLIEVKAKSYDPHKDGDFRGKSGGITSDWKPYLLDVAFQKHVLKGAFPKHHVSGCLMLADKSALCPSGGLHQKIRIVSDSGGRKRAEMTTPLTSAEQELRILCRINADEACRVIENGLFDVAAGPASFKERIEWMAEHYARDEKIAPVPSTVCSKCEFRATPEEESWGKRSGYKECWKASYGWTDRDFETPNVLHIWNYSGRKRLIEENRVTMTDVAVDDIQPKPDKRPGLSQSERQWLQVQKAQERDTSQYLDQQALKREMQQWVFPLHFIDFETTRVAVPFTQGRHPYELVAFQFSHHVVECDGSVRHHSEFLSTERGVFPNYDFLRALQKELEINDGSIFRYGTHENSTLIEIDRQLAKEAHPPSDVSALREFIRLITTSPKDGVEKWSGPRSMIDMCELVKRYFYAPSTNGSNSIKAVLPAILNQSEYLKGKYSQPVYGDDLTILSKNFRNKVWVQMEGSNAVDPYKLLPKMFADVSDHDLKRLSEEDEVREGGAAMTAYARMQFEEMEEVERQEIRSALLRYCELDTLAMVMIYEAWREWVG
jgi:hypothetical protein